MRGFSAAASAPLGPGRRGAARGHRAPVPCYSPLPYRREYRMTRPLPVRWLILQATIVVYAFAVRQIRYGEASGIVLIDQGSGWYLCAVTSALLGTCVGIR